MTANKKVPKDRKPSLYAIGSRWRFHDVDIVVIAESKKDTDEYVLNTDSGKPYQTLKKKLFKSYVSRGYMVPIGAIKANQYPVGTEFRSGYGETKGQIYVIDAYDAAEDSFSVSTKGEMGTTETYSFADIDAWVSEGSWSRVYKGFARGGSTSDDSPKIYVADLAAYNDGKLVGEWLDLSDYSDGDEVMDAIQELLDKWSEEQGKTVEEFAIHDTENIPSGMASEYMGKADFDKITKVHSVADSIGIPVQVVLQWMNDAGYDDPADAENAYSGTYGSEEDYAQSMIDEGVMTDLTGYIEITDTDRRIIAGEEADNIVDNGEEDDMIAEAGMEDEVEELKEKESKKDELESELSDLDEEDDADEYERVSGELAEYEDFDYSAEHEKVVDAAKDKIRDEAYDRIYDDLSDPVHYFCEEQGIYTEEELAKQSFIRIDLEKLARELGYDVTYIHHDGEVYVFNQNFAKGGSVGGKKKSEKFSQSGKVSVKVNQYLNKGRGENYWYITDEENKVWHRDGKFRKKSLIEASTHWFKSESEAKKKAEELNAGKFEDGGSVSGVKFTALKPNTDERSRALESSFPWTAEIEKRASDAGLNFEWYFEDEDSPVVEDANIHNAVQTAENVMKVEDEKSDAYKAAKKFLDERATFDEDEQSDLDWEFQKKLAKAYLPQLVARRQFLMSKATDKDVPEAEGWLFDADGEVVERGGKKK